MRQIDGTFTHEMPDDATSDVGEDSDQLDTAGSRLVALPLLLSGTLVTLHTRNSCYWMEVVDGATRRVRITGGSMFPESTEVEVAGALVADGVKVGWIAEGLRLQLYTDWGPVITSAVNSIAVDVNV